MEVEVKQNVVDKQYANIERKNLLIENENLIADCLSNELLYSVINDVNTVSRFFDLHDAYTITRAKTIEKTTSLLTENEKLKAQLKGKMQCVTIPAVKPKVLAPGMYAIDVEQIPPRNRNNREVHLDYLKHLKESVETLREIVKEARIEKPLDNALGNACFYTKQSQEMLEYKPTRRKFTLGEQCPLTRFTKSKVVPVKQPECVSSSNIVITERFSNNSQQPLTRYKRKTKQEKEISNGIPTIAETQSIDASVVQIVLWYLESGCSKRMTGNHSWLRNFMKKLIGTVRFGNGHFGAIMGYGDYVISDSVISKVYYVEGRGHNLFSIGKFFDSDLEVAFKKHSCYVRNEDGVDLLKRSRGSNLYTISVEDMMKSSLICLLSEASKNKSWLWHLRLNHLNFGTINDLARKDLVRGLPRLQFEKYHLCSACQLGKSKKYTHKPKSENTIMEVLHTLHIDLCGPMRVQSINGKKHILVIVDDYSRFTWVKFLRLKDETPEFVIKFLKQIQVGLNKTVRYIRTDNGTEFINQVLTGYYEKPPSVERPIPPAPAVQVLVVSAGTPSSTTINQDAPSTSHSPSSSEVRPHILHQGVAAGPTIEDNPFAQAQDNPFVNVFALEPSSKESPSGDVSSPESNQVI
ncbi:retrovirus-related pol polyprotein from transposon TNT 1-94 [Tanacetum coccineum]